MSRCPQAPVGLPDVSVARILDPYLERAISQACFQLVAGSDIQDTAHNVPVLCLQNRVAARHRGQWAHGFEGTGQATQPQRIIGQLPCYRRLWALRQQGEAFAQALDPTLRVRGAQNGLGVAQASLFTCQALAPCQQHPTQGLLLTAAQGVQARLGTLGVEPQGGAVGALHGLPQALQ